jgi:ATP cone domain.
MSQIMVNKRNGSKEPFIIEKIVVSCVKAGADIESARKVAKNIEKVLEQRKVEVVDSNELTKLVFNELKRLNEEWYKNWIVYDKAVKRRDTSKLV